MAPKYRLQLLQIFVFLLLLSFVTCKCKFGGKSFESFRVVYYLYDEEHDWCSVGLCKEDGQIWKLVDLNCGKRSVTETAKAITTSLQTAEPGARCIYEGKEYSPSSEIFRGFDELKGVCYTVICTIKGEVVTRDRRCKTTRQPVARMTTEPVVKEENRAYSTRKPDVEPADNKETYIATPFSLGLVTNSPQTQPIATKPPPIDVTTPFGCYVDGKFFPPRSQISEGYDDSSDWCYGRYCGEGGAVIPWDTWNCKRGKAATTTPPTEYTSPPPKGCYDNGVFYRPGEKISEDYDESSDWCYGRYCGEDGAVIPWDTWNCKRGKAATTTPPIEYITPPPKGCYDNGVFYRPGEKISEGYDESSDWCYGRYCGEDGAVIPWDTWNCKRGKVTTTTPPIEYTTPPPPKGCYDNGVFYRPGEKISKGYEESSDWCYGKYCDENSYIVSWDTWNCKKRTSYPPTALPTTMPMARKCKYGSSLYNDGDKVYERYDKQNNWCYGLFCSNEGQLVYWDKWNCKEVATISVPLLQKNVKKEMGSSPDDKSVGVGCLYKGAEYFSRQVIKKDCTNGNRCKVLFCNHHGIVVPKLLKDISRKE